MLAITICATSGYCHAMRELLLAVQAALLDSGELQGDLIFSGDGSDIVHGFAEEASRLLPDAWRVHVLNAAKDHPKDYKSGAQMTIAALRTAAFESALETGASECWSLDSDVLPPPESLRVMRDALAFDRGYYSIATCPYPAPSGGFLFGRGVSSPPSRHICENVYEDERIIPEELLAERIAFNEAAMNFDISQPNDAETIKRNFTEWNTRFQDIENRIKGCPPKGNVHALNAVKWRKRGWGWAAYPAIGRGSMVPTDWCGFGCTLMNRQALELIDFAGYKGHGTEDLHVVWKCWHPKGLKIAALPHVVCDHVIRTPAGSAIESPFTLARAGHETEGETVGHLKVEHLPWPPNT